VFEFNSALFCSYRWFIGMQYDLDNFPLAPLVISRSVSRLLVTIIHPNRNVKFVYKVFAISMPTFLLFGSMRFQNTLLLNG
jgi:hypothetical protein